MTSRALFLGPLVFLLGCDSSSPLSPDGLAAPDAGADAARPDVLRPDVLPADGPGPLANVYRVSPIEDQKQTSQVMLKHITDVSGLLVGEFAKVWNCVNEPGGPKISLSIGGTPVTGSLCVLRQRAQRGTDGSYLHIVPPASDTDGGDAFAEVMMYHHITSVGESYKTRFGLSQVDKPLRAIVNLQAYVNLLSGWVGLPNAAYVPQESASQFKKLLGVDLLEGEEGIVFGYNNVFPGFGNVNFAYDATVIAHEYTHFAVGPTRLWEPAPDQYGLDPTPIALNEALADYFSCSFHDTSLEGRYALGSSARDLTRVFSCPAHIVNESHYDGEIASGSLWAARGIVSATLLDAAIWRAVLGFTPRTTYALAATAILDEIKQVAPDKEEAVRQIFSARGLMDCVRLRDHVDYKDTGPDPAPRVEGKATASLAFSDGVPGAMQYRLPILDTSEEVVIDYTAEVEAFMGTAGRGDVSVTLRKGSDPILYDYSTGKATSTAQTILKGTDTGSTFRLVLSGTCISKGDLVFQFINNGSNPVQIPQVTITQSPTRTSSTTNFDGC
jgi:hypothetical protein